MLFGSYFGSSLCTVVCIRAVSVQRAVQSAFLIYWVMIYIAGHTNHEIALTSSIKFDPLNRTAGIKVFKPMKRVLSRLGATTNPAHTLGASATTLPIHLCL